MDEPERRKQQKMRLHIINDTISSSLIVDENWSKAEIFYLLNDNIWQWKPHCH